MKFFLRLLTNDLSLSLSRLCLLSYLFQLHTHHILRLNSTWSVNSIYIYISYITVSNQMQMHIFNLALGGKEEEDAFKFSKFHWILMHNTPSHIPSHTNTELTIYLFQYMRIQIYIVNYKFDRKIWNLHIAGVLYFIQQNILFDSNNNINIILYIYKIHKKKSQKKRETNPKNIEYQVRKIHPLNYRITEFMNHKSHKFCFTL